MTFPSLVPLCVGGVTLLIVAYMVYRLAQFALRTKGDVNVMVARGKTVFKLQAKEKGSGK